MSRRQTVAVEMEKSWLIQRLRKPVTGPLATAIEAFSFGGGRQNGGLSDDAMGLLRQVFSFDYMGAAEFEWGAVPKALNRIANAADRYEAWKLNVGRRTIYVLCEKDHKAEVKTRIEGWATGTGPRLKEGTRLSTVLDPSNDWAKDICGWLELDNGFFFFTDEAMWQATARLFGIGNEVARSEPHRIEPNNGGDPSVTDQGAEARKGGGS